MTSVAVEKGEQMYKSPIDIIYGQMNMQMEGTIMRAVQNVDVNVDKEELIRALQYDRGQYERGYQDAMDKQKWIPVTERLPELVPCNAGTAYSEAVIVFTDERKAMIAVWDGIDFLCAADYWEAWGEKITHWMPLPELPTTT